MGELPSAGAQGQWAWMLHTAKSVHLWGGQHEPMGSLLVVWGGCGESGEEDRCSEREEEGKRSLCLVTALPRADPWVQLC